MQSTHPTLGRTQLLAALGEFVPFEQRIFMGELFVDRFDAVDFLAHRVDLQQQLRVVDQVSVGRDWARKSFR